MRDFDDRAFNHESVLRKSALAEEGAVLRVRYASASLSAPERTSAYDLLSSRSLDSRLRTDTRVPDAPKVDLSKLLTSSRVFLLYASISSLPP